MPRFESPSQVAGLFLLATVVSIGLIFLIKAEARSRFGPVNNTVVGAVDETSTTTSPISLNSSNNSTTKLKAISKSLKSTLQNFYSNFLTGLDRLRLKRSVNNTNRIRHARKLKLEVKKEEVAVCYKTDDVLMVVGLTCFLNFAFVIFIWGIVLVFRRSSCGVDKSREKTSYFNEETDDDDDDYYYKTKKCNNFVVKRSHSMEELRWSQG